MTGCVRGGQTLAHVKSSLRFEHYRSTKLFEISLPILKMPRPGRIILRGSRPINVVEIDVTFTSVPGSWN